MKQYRGILAVSLFFAGLPGVSTLSAQTAEVTSKDAPLTFKSGINLVPVPVVVRDNKGHAVGDLAVGDFQLFDNGKLQMISKFTVEKLAADKPAKTLDSATARPQETPAVGGASAETASEGIPDRFVAYLFDDVHMTFSDLVYTRDAAKRQIDSSLHALDRAAIYTTSGRTMQDFTADRDKLHAALAALATGQAEVQKQTEQSMCPPMTYYMADKIENLNDQTALNIAMADAIVCANINPPNPPLEITLSHASARQALMFGDRDAAVSLETLRSVVAKMAVMPGQRTIVLVSPGFLVVQDRQDDETRLIERAIRANVVIGGLDARGVYTQVMGGDASERPSNLATMAAKYPYVTAAAMAQTDVMANLSSGTGGTLYEGSNDFDAGFARTATAPEYVYVLSFSPLGLKTDGHFHNLKIVINGRKGLSVQARKGYYAPRYSADPKEQANQELEDEFFSRDEVHDLPAQLQTGYFKSDNGDATLSAVAKIDVTKLNFHKEADRNRNDVTVITGLFDSDGNFVSGQRKVLEMRLLDDTLGKRLGGGVAVKSSFTVHPGRYVVRMVVRDTEGQLMAAQSSLVEIP